MAEGGADLVIGIGNPLRGDDGVGWWLAERAEQLPPGTPTRGPLLVRTVQQLTPELAAELTDVRRVLFIDAWWPPGPGTGVHQAPERPQALEAGGDGGSVAALAVTASNGRHTPRPSPHLQRLNVLSPERRPAIHEEGAFSHHLDPARLLAITALLYGAAPQGWQLLVPAFAMPHGQGLSLPLRQLLPAAEAQMRHWLAAAPATDA